MRLYKKLSRRASYLNKCCLNSTSLSGNTNTANGNLHRRHKEDRNGGGRGSGPESRGRPWSRLFERECPTRANGSGKDLAGSLFVNYGRSMPLLPTTVSQCNLTDDSFSCTNLSVGLTGFPELPAKVSCYDCRKQISLVSFVFK